jgi:hypothetical protein
MTAKTVTLPEGTIVGKMNMTAKIGDIIQKTGKARKQNVYDVDFGQVAVTGSLYGKIDGLEYDVILVPKKA